jgi:hypothetical protein
MQPLADGRGARGVVARTLELAPVPQGDAMVTRVATLIGAIEREGDVRRALRKVGLSAGGRGGSRIGDVAAVAAALDESTDERTDAGELAVRALLEVLLDAPELSALLPAFVARLTERWVLVQLGPAPTDHFASVAEHAQFRAELASAVRDAARGLEATELDAAFRGLADSLRRSAS